MKTPMLSPNSAGGLAGISRTAVYNRIKQHKIECPKHGGGTNTILTFKESRKIFYKPETKTTKKLSIHIVKGGVGKTVVAVNLACCLNAFGFRVLVIDADPQANLTDNFSIDSLEEKTPILIDYVKNDKCASKKTLAHICDGLDLIPSRIDNVLLDHALMLAGTPVKEFFDDLLINIIDDYDFVLIDCPPALGQIVSCTYMFSDYILAPLNPDKYSNKAMEILKKEDRRLKKLHKKNIKYKVFLNKFTPQTILSAQAVSQIMHDEELMGNKMETIIRQSQDVSNYAKNDESLFSSIKKAEIREDFEMFAKEVIELEV